jgi:hypothetical protein
MFVVVVVCFDVAVGPCALIPSVFPFVLHPPRLPTFVRRILNKKHLKLQVEYEENSHQVPSASQTGEHSLLFWDRRELTTITESSAGHTICIVGLDASVRFTSVL